MTLLFLESVGTTELLVILVAALVLFGPRRLPELSRSLGKGLNEFKRASDEFKRTWEREVNLESYDRERQIGEAMLPPDGAPPDDSLASPKISAASAGLDHTEGSAATIARDVTMAEPTPPPALDAARESGAVEPQPHSPHKADWL